MIEKKAPKQGDLFTKTKVVCTIGPAVDSLEGVMNLLHAGMNIARVNFSYGQEFQHKKILDIIKLAREKAGLPLAIMLDTKGPELRVGSLKDGAVEFALKQQVKLVGEAIEGTSECIPVTPGSIVNELKEGMNILFDDGYISSRVIKEELDGVIVEIDHPGILRSGKGINIPGVSLPLPAVTEKDIADIKFGCKEGVDMIAASFIRNIEHLREIRSLLKSVGGEKVRLLAKIENKEGVDNYEEILAESDGIMIARGDLGVEIRLSQVPPLQKKMIKRACAQGKPTITATEMLESMIYNPRPTRAETSDVANAIFDSSSCVMLSGETAMGKYPIESVLTMKEIISEAEKSFDYKRFYQTYHEEVQKNIPAAIGLAAVKTAATTKAKAIFCFTTSGFTARSLSMIRPCVPILSLTTDSQVYYQMAANWGVVPLYSDGVRSIEDAYAHVCNFALKEGFVKIGDLVVIVAGAPFGVPGTANMMLVETVGDVLFRGSEGYGPIVQGRLVVIDDVDKINKKDIKNKIVMLSDCQERYFDILDDVKGVILANHPNDHESPRFAKMLAQSLDFSLISGVNLSFSPKVGSEDWVTLDPENKIMFENYFHEGRDSKISHPLS